MRMLVIGAPGSGKGTQGTRLAAHYRVAHLAAGDMLRTEIEAGTPVGRRAAELVARGALVPDDLVLDLVVPRVMAAAADGGYILDGFPRSVRQAEAARQLAQRQADDVAVRVAINIEVPRRELIRRLLQRAEIEGRVDDTIDVITHRLQVFDEAIAPLLATYADRGCLVNVDGTGSPDQVFTTIIDAAHRQIGS